MTTPLVRPLTREILVSGTTYKVTLTTDRIVLKAKGRRKGVEITWDELITFEVRHGEAPVPTVPPPEAPRKAPPRAVLTDIVREVRAASAALTRADDVLTQAGALPAALMAEMAADPTYGRSEPMDHWFVEPLLTIAEVASILRLSPRAVRRLSLPTITLAGEPRYRQSELREYLRRQESKPTTGDSRR